MNNKKAHHGKFLPKPGFDPRLVDFAMNNKKECFEREMPKPGLDPGTIWNRVQIVVHEVINNSTRSVGVSKHLDSSAVELGPGLPKYRKSKSSNQNDGAAFVWKSTVDCEP
jgi:hypothetical protein